MEEGRDATGAQISADGNAPTNEQSRKRKLNGCSSPSEDRGLHSTRILALTGGKTGEVQLTITIDCLDGEQIFSKIVTDSINYVFFQP